MTHSCLTCRFAKTIDPDEYTETGGSLDLECRRHAPQVVSEPSLDGDVALVAAYYPCVSAFWWCGDWEHQEVEP